MINEKIFPTILMALDFIAAVPYIAKGDIKMTVYWIAAGGFDTGCHMALKRRKRNGNKILHSTNNSQRSIVR